MPVVDFDNNRELIGNLPFYNPVRDEEIENEPMLFSSSWDFAINNGGPLTHFIMGYISETVFHHSGNLGKNLYPIIDTRSTMLMEGFYPCIPGWHCDGVPRHKRFQQPDMSQVFCPESLNITVQLCTEGLYCPTRIVTGKQG